MDQFKSFNDTFGHLPGDRALCFIVAQIKSYLRAGDVLARVGGEEFMVLSMAAGHGQAMRLAQRVRQGVQELRRLVPRALLGGRSAVAHCFAHARRATCLDAAHVPEDS